MEKGGVRRHNEYKWAKGEEARYKKQRIKKNGWFFVQGFLTL